MAETFDFGKGPIACRKHNFGNGLVASTAQVAGTVCVGSESVVGDEALIEGHVSLLGRTVVKNQAVIRGKNIRLENCILGESCRIGDATTLSNVTVCGYARIEKVHIDNNGRTQLVIDETPVVVTGIGNYPIIIIPSPVAFLLIGSYLWPLNNETFDIAYRLEQIGIKQPVVDSIVRIAYVVMKLRGAEMTGYWELLGNR